MSVVYSLWVSAQGILLSCRSNSAGKNERGSDVAKRARSAHRSWSLSVPRMAPGDTHSAS